MKAIIEKLIHCYHAANHAAHKGERPLHGAYFVIVAFEAHGLYGAVAGVCAVVMFLTLREDA